MRESQLSQPLRMPEKHFTLKDQRRIQQIVEGLPGNTEEPGTEFQGSLSGKGIQKQTYIAFHPISTRFLKN